MSKQKFQSGTKTQTREVWLENCWQIDCTIINKWKQSDLYYIQRWQRCGKSRTRDCCKGVRGEVEAVGIRWRTGIGSNATACLCSRHGGESRNRDQNVTSKPAHRVASAKMVSRRNRQKTGHRERGRIPARACVARAYPYNAHETWNLLKWMLEALSSRETKHKSLAVYLRAWSVSFMKPAGIALEWQPRKAHSAWPAQRTPGRE